MSDYIVIHGIKVHKDYVNFVPETFGRLTTIGPVFKVGRERFQVFQCTCGEFKVLRKNNVSKGSTKSCGCRRYAVKNKKKKHGMCGSKEYGIWSGMLSRCNSPKHASYPNYGGKGIAVCPSWYDFRNFYADMGPMPTPDHSIDRYPNRNGNYEPGNCRWATREEQQNNLNGNVRITAFGRTQTLAQWSKETGTHRACIQYRLSIGMDAEIAMTMPKTRNDRHKKNNRHLTAFGETKTLVEWAETHGLLPETISSRIKSGWPVEKALTTPTKKANLPLPT